MSMELPHDPRTALVRTKYFSLRPKPLERWLWKQAIPQAAERVFWLHWEEGMRAGTWCSEIPIKRVARECAIDPSTVTRAYQLLKALELIRREDPGRDPRNPFAQATAVTEVRLPRELVTELSSLPNRPSVDRAQAKPAPQLAEPTPPSTVPAEEARAIPQLSRAESQALWKRLSPAELARYFNASRDRLTAFEFDTDTKLSPADRGHLLAQLAQLAATRPTQTLRKTAANVSTSRSSAPRRLTVLEVARTRKQLLNVIPGESAEEVLRQVIWAVEEGTLRRFGGVMALNIALKKIREGAWSKPHRMPPNWMPTVKRLIHAVPETCAIA
jgi:site-specific DNA-cytosine methylase